MSGTNINPPHLTDNDIRRFWSKVNKSPGQGPKGECWEWTDKLDPKKPYGRMMVRGRNGKRALKPNRLSFFLTTRRWPTRDVLHSCDNPPCCNPDHLREGTTQENTAEREAKNRTARGERHGSVTKPEKTPRGIANGMSTITEDVARTIKRLTADGVGRRPIARILKLNPSTVSHIVKGRTWKHI